MLRQPRMVETKVSPVGMQVWKKLEKLVKNAVVGVQ